MGITKSIEGANPGKAGIEHVRKFNRGMEGTMKDDTKRKRSPRTTKDSIIVSSTYEGFVCPNCEDKDFKSIIMQYRDGIHECPACGYAEKDSNR